MPATEQTWYNQKLLHVIFGLSSLVLLGATIWTLVKDHYRPWKVIRTTQVAIDTQYGQYKILEEQTARFQQGLGQLERDLAIALRQLPTVGLIKKFQVRALAMFEAKQIESFDAQKINDLYAGLQKLHTEDAAPPPETLPAKDALSEAHAKLFTALQEVIGLAEFNEMNLANRKKAYSSQRDAARSNYDLAIRDSLPTSEVSRRLKLTHEKEAAVAQVIGEVQEIKAARIALLAILTELTAPVADATKALGEYRADIDRLHLANIDRSGEGWSSYLRWILDQPILDMSGTMKPDQIWIPKLTINYNLRDVARFDRCITCHRALTTTEPGLATTPAYPRQHTLSFELTPAKPVSAKPDEQSEPTLLSVYGMRLAPRGLLNQADVTIIVPEKTLAAKAGLKTADVLTKIGGRVVLNRAQAEGLLLTHVTWGQPLVIEIRRGLPHPYSAHPRLDLYGTDGSPHPFTNIGCTVCHDGQGPATAFQHAEHTPSTTTDEDRWRKDHGWYANHFWEFPQQSKRFLESNCLKCHHTVTELEPSDRFPDPPAPKLMHGYNLVRKYGCFGCHDINGYDGPDKTIGPDLRIEPDYFTWATILEQAIAPEIAKRSGDHTATIELEQKLVAQRDALMTQKNAAAKAKQQEQAAQLATQLTAVEELLKSAVLARRAVETPYDELQQMLSLAQAIRAVPEDSQSRSLLRAMLNADADRVVSSLKDEANGTVPLLSSKEHAIAARLEDVTTPGTMRKVGPSLRYARSKLDEAFLRDWLSDPKHFRPDTRMPRIFGNLAHLLTKDGSETESYKTAKRFEAVEIRAITQYLLSASQPFQFIQPPANIVPVETDEQKQEQIGRGRDLVVIRGCLACHSIRDEGRIDEDADPDEEVSAAIAAFGKADQDQGPDLSRIGAKLAARGSAGERDPQKWLYSWLRQPSRYHARTKMPDLFLDPIPVPTPVSVETAPESDESPLQTEGDSPAELTDPAADIAAYLLSLQGATPWQPIQAEDNDQALDELALMHLSKAFRKSLAEVYVKTGIPASRRASLKGDEVELVTDGDDDINHKKLLYVGRRSISKYGCFGCHDIPGFEDFKPIGTGLADWGRKGTSRLAFKQITKYHGIEHGAGHEEGSHSLSDGETEQREAYFHHRLLHGDRDGFLWQKLREPRSFDYRKTETKSFNEWLRMPKFNFSGEEIEAVMTFVLGLVAEPPAEQYLYQPDPRRRAIVEGRAVLRKYNCQGCHVLTAERLDLAIEPGSFATPEEFNNYDFLRSLTTPQQLKDSQVQDRRGRISVRLYGLDAFSDDSPTPYLLTDADDPSSIYEDDPDFPYDGPFFRPFVLWKNTIIDGSQHLIGQRPLILSESDVLRKVPVHGGVATRLMMPLIYEQIKPGRANLTGNATRALVAPPLLGEGRKVQTAWLHDFLLDPYRIRPAVQLRMPKFNMSPQEAAKLVAYFAAVDGVDHPYTFDPHTRAGYLDKMEARHSNHLGDAMKILTGVCSECHKIGDFSPEGDVTAIAPNLDRVQRRLRPGFLRAWIASPKSTLPYTEMPVNFSHEQLKFQQYYHGTSAEQIGAVVDLLLNYDQQPKSQLTVSEMVKKAKAAAGPKSEGDEPAE